MTTAAPSTALATIQPAFTDAERLALAGFLAGYRGLTRDAYALDLRQFTAWCRARSLNLSAVRRADIEGFARDLEARGRARATVTRRLCTIAGFYRYAVEEELLDHSPAAHVRRPRVDYESHAVALDRNELGALLVAAGLGSALEHALISLLALNGLRVSEATAADIEHLGLERGHRTLTITRKGCKVVTIPLAPCTARAIDLAIGNELTGRCSRPPTGGGWTGTAPGELCARSPAAPGTPRPSRRTRSDTHSLPPRSMRGSRCAMSKRPPLMPIRGPRCGTTAPAAAWTDTPPISSPPTSQAPPGKLHAGSNSAWRHSRQADSRRPSKILARKVVTNRNRDMSGNRRSAWLAVAARIPNGRARVA
jgi:integrase/recombinase XerD